MASHELSVEPQVSEIPRLLDWVEACCGADGVGDEVRYKIMLALEEAVANVINHAFAERAAAAPDPGASRHHGRAVRRRGHRQRPAVRPDQPRPTPI